MHPDKMSEIETEVQVSVTDFEKLIKLNIQKKEREIALIVAVKPIDADVLMRKAIQLQKLHSELDAVEKIKEFCNKL